MKNKILSTLGLAIFGLSFLSAQVPANQTVTPMFISGDMKIDYNTRKNTDSDGTPKIGTIDEYEFKINVSNSSIFRGTIKNRPFVKQTFGSNQQGAIAYSVDCDIVNPKNVAQTKNVGKFFGSVPIDENNVYRFTEGNLKAGIFGINLESKFSGLALGKPPTSSGGIKESLSFFKNVGGKTVGMKVTNYDKMEFQNLVLASGPVGIYPEVTLNGAMVYDYGRNAWHFKNVGISYVTENKRLQDTLTGDVRWVESPNRKTSGDGEYVFDIRVNDPPPSENAVFSSTSDESAFFGDTSDVAALVGSMKYKDAFSGDKVTGSTIKIDLKGNKLTKQQMMYLYKMLFFVSIVPFNAE